MPDAAAPAQEQVKVYDVAAARPGIVSADQAKSNPQRFQPIGQQPVKMLDRNGKMWTLPAADVDAALGMGASFLPEDLQYKEGTINQLQARHNSAFDVAAHEAVNQAVMGGQEAYEEHALSPEEQEAWRRSNAEHKAAQVVGGVGGFALGTAATGGLGKLAQGGREAAAVAEAARAGGTVAEGTGAALDAVRAAREAKVAAVGAEAAHAAPELAAHVGAAADASGAASGRAAAAAAVDQAAPGLRARLAQYALSGAGEGLLYSTPAAMVHGAYGDPEQAAEHLVAGVGIGGLLGLGGGALSELLAGGANKVKGSLLEAARAHGFMDADGKLLTENLLRKAEEHEAAATGIAKGAKKMGRERQVAMGKAIEADNTLGTMTADELKERLGEVGERIGGHSKSLDAAMNKAPAEARAAVEVPRPAVGDQPAYAGLRADAIADDVMARVRENMAGVDLPIGKKVANVLNKDVIPSILAAAKRDGGVLTFQELQQLKNAFSTFSGTAAAKKFGTLTDTQRMYGYVGDALRSAQQNAMDSAFTKLDLIPSFAKYAADKQEFGVIKDILNGGRSFDQWGNQVPGGQMGKAASAVGGAVGRGIMGPIGHVVGGPLGGLGGMMLGGTVGRNVLGPILQKKGNQLAASVLEKIAAGEYNSAQWLGAALAKNTSALALQRSAQIPRLIAGNVAAQVSKDPISDFLGKKAVGLTKDQQFEKVKSVISQAVAQPDAHKAELEAYSTLFGFDPMLQSALKGKHQAVVDYLFNKLPQAPSVLKPFQKEKWQPPPAQKKSFTDALEIVHDPWSAVAHAHNNTLSDTHKEALQTLYPAIYSAIMAQVGQAGFAPDAPRLSAGSKQGYNKLTNGAIDGNEQRNWQAGYQFLEKQAQANPPRRSNRQSKLSDSMMTPVQSSGARYGKL